MGDQEQDSHKMGKIVGHGHVVPAKDGSKARCGGPGICPECSIEIAALKLNSSMGGGSMITIKSSKTADSRTCDFATVTREQLLESTRSHIRDVKEGFNFFIDLMFHAQIKHDWTKLEFFDDFYRNFKTGFKEEDWWQHHQKLERHHFKCPDYVREDINLIDVLEQIIDGVMAGLARSGEYRQEQISPELLMTAYLNTVQLLLKKVIVVETEGKV